MDEFEEAWFKLKEALKEALKEEQPFKFIYKFSVKLLDWLENILP